MLLDLPVLSCLSINLSPHPSPNPDPPSPTILSSPSLLQPLFSECEYRIFSADPFVWRQRGLSLPVARVSDAWVGTTGQPTSYSSLLCQAPSSYFCIFVYLLLLFFFILCVVLFCFYLKRFCDEALEK